MTQPSVIITELDGALGVLPPSTGALLAIVGTCTTGPFDTPAAFARISDIQGIYTSGPAVEAAAHYIERYGRAVLFVRSNANVAASIDAVDDSGVTGTSTVTASGTPTDDTEPMVEILTGGTVATAGIIYRVSLDAGRNWGPATALGVAEEILMPDGVQFDLGAGTLVTGDVFGTVAHAAQWNSADIQSALLALRQSQQIWEIVQIVGAVDATTLATIDLSIAGMASVGKYRAWIGNARIPDVGESEAAYATSLASFASAATKYGSVYAGGCKLVSSVSGRRYRRPVSFATAAREAASSQEINIADINIGPLEGVTITDVNGNPDEHNESVSPGLDDLRFGTLRTWDEGGEYVNRPRLFSPAGSDFQLMPHRRVLNLVHGALRSYFIRRLNKPVYVDKATGFILAAEALEIETGALAVMRAVALAKPKASAVQFKLSRTDNLLSTRTMTGDARVTPLAYPETIQLTVGFINPALQIIEV